MRLNEIDSIVRVNLKKYDYCISWRVNNICNYNCYFCIQKDSNARNFTKEDLTKNKKELSTKSILKKGRDYDWK